jgi:hypothetical protein
VPIHFEKHILRNLFGQTAVSGHAQSEGEDHGLLLVNKFLEIRLPVRLGFGGHISRRYSLIRREAGVGMQRIRGVAKKVLDKGFGLGYFAM